MLYIYIKAPKSKCENVRLTYFNQKCLKAATIFISDMYKWGSMLNTVIFSLYTAHNWIKPWSFIPVVILRHEWHNKNWNAPLPFPISTKGQKFNHHCCYCYNNICMGNSHSYWPPNSLAACGHFVLPKNRGVSHWSYPLIPAGWVRAYNTNRFFDS